MVMVIKKTVCIFTLILLLNLSGCKKNILPKRYEINELMLVQVVGIDKFPESPNDCMLTVASKDLDAGGGQGNLGSTGKNTGSTGEKALILTSEGKTMFDAARNLQTHSNKTIFWGHTDYYLIGEEAARDNIAKYIDFFTRDHELRIDSKVYIVKGSTAKELIEQFNQLDFFIFDKLESLGQNIRLLGTSYEIEVHELMRFLDIHHASARIPCIYLAKRSDDDGKQIMDIESGGYAIFSDLKLAGYIGPDISRGINAITNTLDSSVVVVKDLAGKDVSLEIIDCKTKVIPFFEGNTLKSVTINTKVNSNLAELQSQTDFTDEQSLRFMESQQSAIIKKEIESVIEKVIEYESDCLEICDRIRLSRPYKWLQIEKKWMEIFTFIEFIVQVDSKIQRTYELKEPSGYKWSE